MIKPHERRRRNDMYVDANPDSTKNVNEVGSKEKWRERERKGDGVRVGRGW